MSAAPMLFGPDGPHALAHGVTSDLSVLSGDQIVAAVEHAQDLWSATEWVLGDLVVEMMRRARDGEHLPDDAWANLHQASAVKAARVAVLFPIERRRPELTWAHHDLVSSLPEHHQDRLLALAVDNGLTVRGLRAVMAQEAEDAAPRLEGMPVARWRPPQRLAVAVGELVAAHPEVADEVEAAVAEVVARWTA